MNLLRHSAAALLGALALPVGALAVAIRPDWREGLAQRLGSRSRGPRGGVWLHGASVGEAAIMARLCPGLEEMGFPVTASLFTPTGCRRFRQLAPGVDCSLAPLDHPWLVDRVLSSLDPVALVLVETELWPFLISGSSRRDVPMAVVSGRLSDRSFENYRRFRPFFARQLARIDRIGARSDVDAERFVALGARSECVEVTGDLKLEPVDQSTSSQPEWDAILGESLVFVAGSTHEGEDEAALEALAICEKAGLEVALVLAPRHMNRVENVVDRVRNSGRTPRLRSQAGLSPLRAAEVLVLDTLGELPACYARARAAFVGGTLIAKGGHNLLEPAQYGVPVCFGPHIENVRESAELLETSGAGHRVNDAKELGAWAVDVLSQKGPNPAAQVGQKMIESHQGSLARSLALLSVLLEGRGE
ncbi:MAG: glycosyltransferase N-terminal domain-containing protein [Myxococcota bacterium]|nr:glycosyltransferase N-terminal domain-containing protein [Myxococcota bacterium]